MRVFYPVEMIELMESQVTEDSSHVTDRGISTLIDLATLHRSELCRLIILRFLFFTSICEATLLFYQIFILKSELEQIFNQEKAFNFLNTKYSGFPHKTTTIDHHIEGLDRVAVALNDIAMNIADKRLSAIDVQRALQQVLVMDIFCGKNRKENSNTHLVKETEIDCETECLRVDPVIMPVDQVFETIVAKDDHEVEKNSLRQSVGIGCGPEYSDDRPLINGAELFAVREKKALAAFYGISEEEMDEKLRLEEDMHIGIADEKARKIFWS
uniref:Ovule protein n=1 Tax=Heterorhabditis bacteriophora TaxID=37862 RepID=A0A1I7XAB0_HETBA